MTSLNPSPIAETHQKLHGLDHLRTVAIALVLLYHYLEKIEGFPSVIKFGWTGVDLFFVLSGFLISSQLFAQIKSGKGVSFPRFFLKRFFRIIPAYWFVLILYFLSNKNNLPPLWKFLTFTQNLGINLKNESGFSQAWSLCVEEHFYLLLPLTLIALLRLNRFKKGYWILILVFVCGIALRHYIYQYLYFPKVDASDSWLIWCEYIYYPSYNRLDGLVMGVGIASVYVFLPELWQKVSKYGNLLIVSSILLLSASYFVVEDIRTYQASVVGFPLVAFGYSLLVIGSISEGSFFYRWKSSITSFMAQHSYCIYLIHIGIINITLQLFAPYHLPTAVPLVSSFILCLICAKIINLGIEQPFIKIGKRVTQAL